MSYAWLQDLRLELHNLEKASLKRKITDVEDADKTWLIQNNCKLLNLSSNNYLGLAGDERLIQAAVIAAERYGSGATASRLIVGNHPLYHKAEKALAEWKGSEAGLIFNSGYTANLGIISAIAGRDDVVFSDKLNHASIVDGIILSRAELKRYRHNDMEHLENLLKKYPLNKRKLIVTDTVFSMDGDTAPLEALVNLKEKYNAILMVDEAHGTGVFGSYGEGLVHQCGLQDKIDIQMGTFSKAMGSFGAYAVGRKIIIDYLINKMRSLIFTTALPPAVLGSIIASIETVQTEQIRRSSLMSKSNLFRKALTSAGLDTCGSETQIIPIVIGPNDTTLEFSRRLQEEGISAVAVRPPTVPNNQARIRFSLMATHKWSDLEWAVQKIVEAGRDMGIIS